MPIPSREASVRVGTSAGMGVAPTRPGGTCSTAMSDTGGLTTRRQGAIHSRPGGYAMAALLVGLSIMSVMFSVALPVWQTVFRREQEAELIFRGEQYVRAVTLFQRKFGGTYPPSVDVLLQGRFLRRRYLDPITNDTFRLLYVGVPSGRTDPSGSAPSVVADGRRGIVGVVSRSPAPSLRLYQGRGYYNEWVFVAAPIAAQESRARESRQRRVDGTGRADGPG